MLTDLPRRSLALAAAMAISSAASAQMAPPSEPPAMTPMAPSPTSEPTTEPAEAAAIKAGLATYNKAVDEADVKGLLGTVYVSTDTQKQALQQMAKLTTAGRGLYDASVAAYGVPALTHDNVSKQSFPGGFPQLSGQGLSVKVSGEKATLSSAQPDGPAALSMIKKDGAWKIDGDALLPPLGAKELADQTSIIDAVIAAIDDTAADVKATKFRGADEALAIMNVRVQKAVRAAREKLAPMEMPAPPTTGPIGPAAPATQPQ